jgi:glutamyl-tRNA reductase
MTIGFVGIWIFSLLDRSPNAQQERADFAAQLIRSETGIGASEVNRAVFRRVFELVMPADLRDDLCLIVMGSEGRGEQILPTDQDNALIVRDGIDPESLMPACRAFSDALESIGYPPCSGGVMVRNPDWVLSESGFRDRIWRWIAHGSNEDVMNLAIFFDAVAVAGDATLLAQVKDVLFAVSSAGDAFFARFASAINAFPVPMGMFSSALWPQPPHRAARRARAGGVRPAAPAAGAGRTDAWPRGARGGDPVDLQPHRAVLRGRGARGGGAVAGEYHRLQPQKISPYLYTLPSRDAVRHMFRVASGLDSMVLGEPQILGQMKQAARIAEKAGTLGTLLHKLFQKTFAVAKEVRSTTAIGANIVSMAAAAVHLAERIFENVAEQKVLFIGAGEMIELCAAHFAAQQPKQITIANRTLARGKAWPRASAADGMRSTRSASAGRVRHRRLLHGQPAADHRPGHGRARAQGAAPPADGDGRPGRAARHRAEIGELDDVFLYTSTISAQIVESGLESRQAAVVEAEAIIDLARGRLPALARRARRCRPSAPCANRRARMRRHEVEHALKLLAKGEDPQRCWRRSRTA